MLSEHRCSTCQTRKDRQQLVCYMCFSTPQVEVTRVCLQSSLPIFCYFPTLGPSGPWRFSAPVSPLVGQWLLPVQPQLPPHWVKSLGVFVGATKQGGGLGKIPAAPTCPAWGPTGGQCGSPSALPQLCSAMATLRGILHVAGLVVGWMSPCLPGRPKDRAGAGTLQCAQCAATHPEQHPVQPDPSHTCNK